MEEIIEKLIEYAGKAEKNLILRKRGEKAAQPQENRVGKNTAADEGGVENVAGRFTFWFFAHPLP